MMISSRLRSRQTPLPYGQVAVLMGVRLAEPIQYTVIFPFINQMIEELGVTDNPDRVGFYSGLVESIFAFVQFFTVYHWAKLSDKIGRKPVILFGLLGVGISGTFFGLSTSFTMMVIVRCLTGALNGNVAVIKASLGDLTDESNSTDAFAMYGLTWVVGSIIGNTMGGTLSHPYERFPQLFQGWELFQTYPYFLPCLVSACCTFLGILFAASIYRETLPGLAESSLRPSVLSLRLFSPTHARSSSIISNMSDTDTLVDPDSPDHQLQESLLAKMSQGADSPSYGAARQNGWGFWDLMRRRPVQVMSVTMFLNQFVGGAWQAASLLFFFDRNNGLGMSTTAIGYALAINGFWSIACQLLLLTRIRRFFGISTAYKILSFGWIPVWFFLPSLRTVLEFSETPLPQINDFDPIRYPEIRGWWTAIFVNLLLSYVTFVSMTGSLLMVLVNFSSPDRTALGAVNGISTAVGCMARVVGPSSVSALFAFSMDGKVLGGRLWWIFMIVMSCINVICALCVDTDPPPANGLSAIDEEEEPPEERWEFENPSKVTKTSPEMV